MTGEDSGCGPFSCAQSEFGIAEGAALTGLGTCLSAGRRVASGATHQRPPAGITGSGRNGLAGLVAARSASPGRMTAAAGSAVAGCQKQSRRQPPGQRPVTAGTTVGHVGGLQEAALMKA